MYYNSSLLLALLLITINGGCKEKQILPDNDVPVKNGNSLLWKIEGNGLKEPSYLYGTIHLIPREDYMMGAHLREVLESSRTLVMEIDMDDLNPMETAMAAMLPGSTTLKDILSESQFDSVKTYLLDTFKVSQLEYMAAQKMKPIFVSQMFLKDAIKDPVAFELEFMEIAREKEIDITGFETAMEQVSFFDSISMERQVHILMESLTEGSEIAMYDKLIEHYKNQEIDSLQAMINEDATLLEFNGLLISNRNKNWVKKLKKMLPDGRLFIAVGAGHLPGEEGVINLLRKEGYKVTPISTEKKK